MPVNELKRKSGQSPNKRREAFKRKRRDSEKNEAHYLKENQKKIGEEPIYENLRKRPTPQKPKRTKLPSSGHLEAMKRISTIDKKTEELKQKILLEHEQEQNKKNKKKNLRTLCKELKHKMTAKPKNRSQKQQQQQER
ncbi:hypothetical protein IGI47_000772 [Enterococcus sp. AZ191]|uniref:hypothetical protein n=1 Tax=Enterococcus sp. AZ191 TaxID=2774639 RepID=UPI003F2124EA